MGWGPRKSMKERASQPWKYKPEETFLKTVSYRVFVIAMGKVTGVQPMHRASPSHLTQKAVRSQRNPWPTLILPEMPLLRNYRKMGFLALTM